MRRKFAANLVFLVTANLLVKPFWIFGIDRVVQNKVGPEVYGTYFAVFNYSFLFSIFLDLGITNFNNRAVSRNSQRASEYMANLLAIKFFLGLIYFVITFLGAIAAGYSDMQMKMLLVLAVNQLLLSLILYFRSNIAALQLFKIDSIISILDRLLAIIFCLVLLRSFHEAFDIMWFIYAQTLALFIAMITAFAIVIKKTALTTTMWKLKFTKKVLLKSFPFALLALLMGIYYRVDGVMLERMLPNGAHEAGIYAASFRLLDALNQIGFLFATLLLPMFAGMIKRKEGLQALVKFSARLMFVAAVIAGVSCFIFRAEIMAMLYPDSTDYWAKIFGWLMLNFIPMSSVYIFGTLLTAKGSLKILNLLALGGMIMNVALNFFLIPMWGALGATIATLATQTVIAILHIRAAKQKFTLELENTESIRLLGFVMICVVMGFVFHIVPIGWPVSFTATLGACFLSAVALKLFDFNKLMVLLKERAAP